jgi:hypothetical protein
MNNKVLAFIFLPTKNQEGRRMAKRNKTHRLMAASGATFLLLLLAWMPPASAEMYHARIRTTVKPLNLSTPPTTEDIVAAGQLGGALYPTHELLDVTRRERLIFLLELPFRHGTSTSITRPLSFSENILRSTRTARGWQRRLFTLDAMLSTMAGTARPMLFSVGFLSRMRGVTTSGQRCW